eukprot:8702737-Pyramimonas_sp.AAC.1
MGVVPFLRWNAPYDSRLRAISSRASALRCSSRRSHTASAPMAQMLWSSSRSKLKQGNSRVLPLRSLFPEYPGYHLNYRTVQSREQPWPTRSSEKLVATSSKATIYNVWCTFTISQ